VQTVAVATEELHASISEYLPPGGAGLRDRQSGRSPRPTATNETVQGLARRGVKIGEVISLIQNIASQTNLWRSTPPSSGAGRRIRQGFAVVATEVKALATQTAKATEDFTAQISAIQHETGNGGGGHQDDRDDDRQMSEIATAIAAAVEQQSAATRDISQNIQEVSRGTSEVSANVGSVNEAANETGAAATEVLTAADDLSHQSEKLRTDVNTFLGLIRAA